MVYNGVFGVLLVLALGLQGNSVSETNAASFMTSANLLRELVMTPEVSLCMAGTSEQDLTAYFNVEAVVLNQCQRHKTPRDECNDRFWSRESVPQEMRDIHMAMRRCSKAEE